MEYLGFATQFFTLWEVSRESVTYYGRPATRVVCTFIKNVSKDEQVARAKYPDAPFDATHGIMLTWNAADLAEYYYSGCTYYLPKQGDKAKRIKGKTLEVSVADYNVEQFPFGKRLSIRVAGFQLKK